MVTSDMQRAADLPSRCCLFNNCVQFTTFYMQRFTTVLRKMQTSIFLLLVIVIDSMLILWKEFSSFLLSHGTMIRKLLSLITAFLYQDNTSGG